ncbi:MAG TPA: 50S ribosomal protein L25 [Methylomirabilota bacterium]|nr:50S ribosomal protein L25 [Methylomirabilota bacterium]
MKSVPLTAFPRTASRRGGVKKLRETGRVPAIIYGGKTQPQNLEFNRVELVNVIHHSASENVLLDLSVKDDARGKRLALVQEVQHHPLKGDILHVDLHEVAEDEKVTIFVPVEAIGDAVGVKTGGGTLEHVLFKIKVRALPKDLPEQINVDVTTLDIGKSVHLGEITPPANVEFLGDKKVVVFSVAAPVTEEQEAAAAEAAAGASGEVEMIKEKKEDGEEGAKAEGKAGEKAAPAKAAPAKAAAGAEKKEDKKK